MPAPHHSVLIGRMFFLLLNLLSQDTEGNCIFTWWFVNSRFKHPGRGHCLSTMLQFCYLPTAFGKKVNQQTTVKLDLSVKRGMTCMHITEHNCHTQYSIFLPIFHLICQMVIIAQTLLMACLLYTSDAADE